MSGFEGLSIRGGKELLDTRKIRLMTKLAVYEDTQGKSDLAIHGYTEDNYVNLQMIKTIICVTTGYGILLFLSCFRFYSEVASQGFAFNVRGFVIPAVVIYILILVGSIIFSRRIYRERFRQMKIRVKEYDRNLQRLRRHIDKKKKQT